MDDFKMNTDIKWLQRMAELEANADVSVGGLSCEVSQQPEKPIEGEALNRMALAKLIELRRRTLGLSIEQLAVAASIAVPEAIALELGNLPQPHPRTLFMLATVLKLPSDKLMQLSGLTKPRDGKLNQAAVRFAARSKSIETLSKDELAAVEEFVRILTER